MELLEKTFLDILNANKWLTPTGRLKKSIVYGNRNMTIEKLEYNIEGDVLIFKFDVHWKTDKEEAIRHMSSKWDLSRSKTYNIGRLKQDLPTMIKSIKKQLIFTDRLDKNLFKYYELESKGWEIIKQVKR